MIWIIFWILLVIGFFWLVITVYSESGFKKSIKFWIEGIVEVFGIPFYWVRTLFFLLLIPIIILLLIFFVL
jgi:hypothetical protein